MLIIPANLRPYYGGGDASRARLRVRRKTRESEFAIAIATRSGSGSGNGIGAESVSGRKIVTNCENKIDRAASLVVTVNG